MDYIWIAIQVLIGYNLFLPFLLFVLWKIIGQKYKRQIRATAIQRDYAVIVTAYQQINTLNSAVDSILKTDYLNYIIYIVADNCNTESLNFDDPRIVLLTPASVLASNTKSHQFAIDHFIRAHDVVTIIDSDNLLHKDYFKELEVEFNLGSSAVQGIRMPKNLDTSIAMLDASRDIYYHFYDGKLLYELGSSATLSGSGMAFDSNLYKDFLTLHSISGAGFDKVLQAWLVGSGRRIAFSQYAIVYDEKTSKSGQLVQQRSRWIRTWIKYFSKGFRLIYSGILKLDKNQLLFGLILLRPPLFIFIILSGLCMMISLFLSTTMFFVWLTGFFVFFLSFFISLIYSNAERKIYIALLGIPKFIGLQVLSLLNVRYADKNSVATSHYQEKNIEDLEKRS